MQRKVIGGLLAMFLIGLSAETIYSADPITDPIKAFKVEKPPAVGVLGDRLPVFITVTPGPGSEAELGFLGDELLGLRIVALGPNGLELQRRVGDHLEPDDPVPALMLQVVHGESFTFGFDLSRRMRFKLPGVYSCRLEYNYKTIAEFPLTLYECESTETRTVKAAATQAGWGGVGNEDLPIDCRVSIDRAKTITKGESPCWLTVERSAMVGSRSQKLRIETPATTKIEQAEIDYAGRLWLAIKSESRWRLVVVDLERGHTDVVSDWVEKRVTLTAYSSADFRAGKVQYILGRATGSFSHSSLDKRFLILPEHIVDRFEEPKKGTGNR